MSSANVHRPTEAGDASSSRRRAAAGACASCAAQTAPMNATHSTAVSAAADRAAAAAVMWDDEGWVQGWRRRRGTREENVGVCANWLASTVCLRGPERSSDN
jgi:hypothetical protein